MAVYQPKKREGQKETMYERQLDLNKTGNK